MTHTIEDVYDVLSTATFSHSETSDMKRSNANINADSPMGAMLTYGTETARMWIYDETLPEDAKQGIEDNLIYIHDMDFYGLTETCCQINLAKLFEKGFNTGHGYVRPPKSIGTAAALTCIVIQSNQNDQHGGQSIPAFDHYLAPYVEMTYTKNMEELNQMVAKLGGTSEQYGRVAEMAWNRTVDQTDQAMEGLIHNLNMMHSRAGAQVPFSSLNYGTDMSVWGRQVTKSLLKATHEGMGHGETPIFPVQIFKVKDGVNYKQGDPNYDLFCMAMRVSAERLFPNFSFLDAPFNEQYLKKDHNGNYDPDTEVAYMGCRTRVMSNVNGPEVTSGRGNLSFTTVNLVRCALDADDNWHKFVRNVVNACALAKSQLMHRYELQRHRRVYNYPFMMGNNVYLDSDDLAWDEEIEEALKHGTLSIGFIGLAEAMIALFGKHHGEDEEVWDRAYEIVSKMREFCDDASEQEGLNFSLLATPAEGLSGKFVPKDVEAYGEIEGVTDKDYYTNSFHIPVYYATPVAAKIEKEAPFHTLCNAGHITYVELDGDTTNNLGAFAAVVRCMHDSGIGYGAINHPVDRDPVCGYRGVIYDTCPCCGRKEYEAVPTDRRSSICLR